MMLTDEKKQNIKNNWVTVIIPTYNREKDLKESISSVLKQSYRDRDIVVVDDGSTDETYKIASMFKKDIQFISLPHSGLPAVTRNAGIKIAKGEYIAFLDSDDAWKENKLDEQIKHFNDNEIVGVGTDATIISKTPYYRQLDFGKSLKGFKDYNYFSILCENPIKTSSVLVKTDIIKDVGGFDEDPKFKYIEDYELWLRMAKHGKFRILSNKLIYYRAHFDKSRKNLDIAKNTFDVLKKHINYGYIKDQKIINEAESSINMSIGFNFLFIDGKEGSKYYLKAFQKTSIKQKKIKAMIGYCLSIQPLIFRNPQNYILHKIDKLKNYLSNILYIIF